MSIKNILCPTDFSKAANNAIEYASRLALKTGAKLTLTHVLAIPEVYQHFSTVGLLNEISEKQADAEEKLKKYINQVVSEFHIPCFYEIDFLDMNSDQAKNASGVEIYDLIICGTNGADTLYQYYFGSTSYRISKKSETPTLIIPEDCQYKEINHVAFASGYKKGDHLLISQLNEFMNAFGPALTIIHVSEKETLISQEVFHSFAHLVDEAFDFSRKINFHRIVSEDEASAIEHFMQTSNADMLAVCMEEHGFLYRMFHTNLIKKITSYASYPVLIFHK